MASCRSAVSLFPPASETGALHKCLQSNPTELLKGSMFRRLLPPKPRHSNHLLIQDMRKSSPKEQEEGEGLHNIVYKIRSKLNSVNPGLSGLFWTFYPVWFNFAGKWKKKGLVKKKRADRPVPDVVYLSSPN